MVIVAVFATACSAIAVRGPRQKPPGNTLVCDSGYAPPVIDAAIALAGVALVVWGATAPEDPEGHTVTARNFAAYPGLAMAIPFGISSAYGFLKVSRCRREAGAPARP